MHIYGCGLWLVNETVLYFFLFARLEKKHSQVAIGSERIFSVFNCKVVCFFKQETPEGRDGHCGNEVGTLRRDMIDRYPLCREKTNQLPIASKISILLDWVACVFSSYLCLYLLPSNNIFLQHSPVIYHGEEKTDWLQAKHCV